MPHQEMLINHVHGEESRIALLADGKLEELYTERTSADLHVGNIYRGRVTNVEGSIQAAFVDFGEPRAGFLHITDLHPRYFPGEEREQAERVGHKTPRRERPPIQKSLRRGQKILVQVLKEGIGTKGPTLTSYLSIPGRYLVMMPYMERHGVSRKIEDAEKRREMRRILDELDPPEDFGFIVRTAGFGRNKADLKRDLNFLLRLWKNIEKHAAEGRGPAELYTESDLVIRTLRDVLTNEVKRIIVDDRIAALRARDFLRIASPRSGTSVVHYRGSVPLFDAFDVERQIEQINQRQVPLPCGGSLVFDQAEALVAIDVNSGKFRDARDAEDTAYRTNLEAVDEIARQLRLRDLGGLLVLDLIDMYVHRHRREVERRFKDHLKHDRARTKVLRISELGMLEMTRQRMRPSLRKSVYDECPTCGGTGHVLSPESVLLQVMRRLAVAVASSQVVRVELRAHPTILAMLLNRKRKALVDLETGSGKAISSQPDPSFAPDRVELDCYNANGGEVDLDKLSRPARPKFSKDDEIALEDLKELEAHMRADLTEEEEAEAEAGKPEDESEQGRKKKRRRRRRRRSKKAEESAAAESGEPAERPEPAAGAETQSAAKDQTPEQAPASAGAEAGDEAASEQPKRRRRRRGGRRHRRSKPAEAGSGDAGDAPGSASGGSSPRGKEAAASSDRKPAERSAPRDEKSDESGEATEGGGGSGRGGRPRRRRRSKKAAASTASTAAAGVHESSETSEA